MSAVYFALETRLTDMSYGEVKSFRTNKVERVDAFYWRVNGQFKLTLKEVKQELRK